MIDILIPVYKAKGTLDRCLASIVMQTICRDVSVTLLNDHPHEEDYSEFIDRYSPVLDIVQLKLAEPVGLGSVRQFGIDATAYEHFCFIDADDTLSDSRALEIMQKSMTEDTAVCSGAFQELLPDGNAVVHNHDMIWVFGKLYQRSFWKKNGVSFMPSSSANEDTGVNAIITMLADKNQIRYVDNVVYQWHYNNTSITRQNDCRYTYDQNVTGYSKNMIRAVNLVKAVSPANPKIVRRVMYDVCNLYKMHLDTHDRAPQYLQSSWNAAKAYYDACFPQESGIPFDILREEFDKVMYGDEFPLRGVIPYITLMDFIRNLAVPQQLSFTDT